LDHIDDILNVIRSSKDDDVAMDRLMNEFSLSEIQAKAVMDMQFRRLTGLQRDKIEAEYSELVALITDLRDILANHSRIVSIIKDELTELRDKYGDKRRTEIIEDELDVQDEDLIPQEEIFITMTANGYIKRIPINTYRLQNRGGKGVKGMSVNSDDVVELFMKMNTHDYLLLFTNYGKVYRMKGYKVPNGSRTAKGLPVVNLLSLDKNEKVKALITDNKENDEKYLVFATKEGLVKRVSMKEFALIRQGGKIAITLREGDELISVKMTNGEEEIIIGGSNGKVVRFPENQIRPMGRTASGVKGFDVDGSEVIGMATSSEGRNVLSITKYGYGKKSEMDEYRLTSRGAKGVKTLTVTEKNGPLVSLRAVNGDEDLLVITNEGIVIRISLESVGTYGRAAQGVRIIQLNEGQHVAEVAIVEKSEENSEEEEK